MAELNKKQKNITKELGKWKTIQLLRIATKIYNTVCIICKAKIMRKPNLDPKCFCKPCAEKIRPLLVKIEELQNESK